MYDIGIDRISRGSRHIGDDHALLAQKFIDNRRFPNVWLSDNRNSRTIVFFLFSCMFREMSGHFIQHIANSQSRCRRNRNRIPDSQIIKFIDIRHKFLKIIYFIYYQNDWFLGSSKHIRNFGIGIHQSLTDVCNKYNDICCIDGNLCLLPHLREDHIAALRLNSSRINQCKFLIQPADIGINPVSGNSGSILDNGYHLPGQYVKECGFPDIRPSYNCYYWFTHISVLLYLLS